MSDSLPPARGRSHHEERDLEAVLSGATAGLHPAMQPAAAVLAALRAAPVPSELNGEAAARAAYRLFVLPESGWPASTAARPPAVGGRPHSHRRVRQLPWPGKRPGTLLLGAAAACIVALACVLAVQGGQGESGRPANTHAASTVSAGGSSPVLEGGATREATPRGTPASTGSHQSASPAGSGPGPTVTALCRQYLSYVEHPWAPDSYQGLRSDGSKLSAAAGGVLRVFGYCTALVGGQSWPQQMPAPEPAPGNQTGQGYPPSEGGSYGQRPGTGFDGGTSRLSAGGPR